MSRLLLLLLALLLLGCGPEPAMPAATAASKKCPPPGTGAEFAQIMNAAFVADFISCHVKVKATFLNANAAAVANSPDPSYVGFTVQPGGPLSGVVAIFIKKEASAIVFQLKQGDPLVLVGGPQSGLAFIADSIDRGP